jgi:hypothetical protein
MTQDHCEKCGSVIQPNDRFCRKCGSRLVRVTVEADRPEPKAPAQEQSLPAALPAASSQHQPDRDGQELLKPPREGTESLGKRGTPFRTGLLLGSAKGFAFMFVAGTITIPTMLGAAQNSTYGCVMFLLAVGAAYGAGQWAKHFARSKGLAPSSVIGEGVGAVIGGLLGAVLFSIIIVFMIMAMLQNR